MRRELANFNPRVPCGTRPVSNSPIFWIIIFQSTGPVWDPTNSVLILNQLRTISIHGSRVGPDLHLRGYQGQNYISIHGSRVGPDLASIWSFAVISISIHGSRVGPDDWGKKQISKEITNFNPRVPCGTRRPRLTRADT